MHIIVHSLCKIVFYTPTQLHSTELCNVMFISKIRINWGGSTKVWDVNELVYYQIISWLFIFII